MTAAPTSTDAQGPPLHALVLAAGASRRFGGVKALALIDGKPMLQWTIDALTEAGVDGLSIVLGAHAAEIIPQINTRGATLVSHEDWTHGMSASLRAGLATVNAHNAGLLIALADQPDIGVDDYRRLIAAWRAEPDRPVAAAYANTRGAPCIIPAALRPGLLQLQGDQGARVLLRTLAEVTEVPMERAARDIDTREDWQTRLCVGTMHSSGQLTEPPSRD
jgi:molybdenum cofactor cytidylyltransferase